MDTFLDSSKHLSYYFLATTAFILLTLHFTNILKLNGWPGVSHPIWKNKRNNNPVTGLLELQKPTVEPRWLVMKMWLVFWEQLLYPFVPLQKSEAGHSGTWHQGHLGFADVVADDRWHWHGQGSVGTVFAPIQRHLHPSASLRYPQQWMDGVCVCEMSQLSGRSAQPHQRWEHLMWIASNDLCIYSCLCVTGIKAEKKHFVLIFFT